MTEVTGPQGLSPTKRAILELRELRRRLAELERARSEPVAVIGMGCRFPGGADSPDAFWRLLSEGIDAIGEVPPDRFDIDAYYDPDPDAPGRIATRWGGFLDRVDLFDAEFFGITPREAEGMDPQQRLLLEVAWEALEHAGQPPAGLAGSPTGVFVGIGTNDYTELRLMRGDPAGIDAYLASGSSHSVASGRLSYLLGFVGPSLSIDTACSSSLVAVHLAVQSLRAGECSLALAGGVNVILLPEMLMTLSKAHMMAADGRCKAFDARADGFVRAEGCGLVALKRLSDALADGDGVLAVIRGSAVNQDGRTSGLTAPNGPSQEAVIRAALADAGVAPAEVSYVEAHGTGTELGDPIEAGALGAVFAEGRDAAQPLVAGSVKTNLGHLEAASGVAGLIKAVLAVERGRIPPNLHLAEPSPLIPWDDLRLTVPAEPAGWPAGLPRIAGVSSFGFSGTNAHVVLAQAPAVEAPAAAAERPCHVLPLSARDEPALRELAGRYARHLDERPGPGLADVCFTAAAGRSHLPERLAVVAPDRAGAAAQLAAYAAGADAAPAIHGRAEAGAPLEAAFLFTGQGSHYPGMARTLWDTEPAFRRALERFDEALAGEAIRPPSAVLFGAGGGALPPLQAEAQPALVALELALAELWRSWGIEPAAVLGHSLGEYAAAHVAGVLSLEDTFALVLARGRAADAVPERGEMWVVRAGEDVVAETIAALGSDLAVAAVNDPTTTVVSGRPAAAAAAVERLSAQGVETRRLDVPYASHSALLDPVLAAFGEAAAGISPSRPAVPLVSCLTGELAAEELLDSSYWTRQLREPVRFAAAVATLARERLRAFVELGPRATLCGMGSRAWPADAPEALWLPSLREGRDDWEQLLEALGTLYAGGAAVDWPAVDRGRPRQRVPLPTYPFQRRRYWIDAAPAQTPRAATEIWEALAEGAAHAAERGPLDLDVDAHRARWEALDRIAVAAMAGALRELGAFATAGDERSPRELVESAGADAMHERLLGRWLSRLAAAGSLEARAGGRYASPEPLPAPELEPLIERARALFDDSPLLPDYVERCARRLPAILTGRETALEALFPGGSFSTAEYLYESSLVPRYANGIVRGAVEAIARSWTAARPLRVLEIGAGTGGTTASVLPVLPRDRTSYVYTDLSDLFLARAEERFRAYPFVSYRLFDAEGDPAGQGVGLHAYDLVVAANVLHATRDLRASLAGARSLLAPGGVLLLYETTSHPAWFDVTIGLIEGWSRFDDGLRADHPLLSPERWTGALAEAGFVESGAWPEAASPASALGVHAIAALAPADPAVAVAAGEAAPASAAAVEANGAAAAAISAELALASPGEREELLVDYVRAAVLRVTRSDASRRIGRRDRLMDIGVDSLMAVELSKRLEGGLELAEPLAATLVFDHPTIEAIARHLDALLQGTAPAPAADEEPAPALVDVESLSEDEVERLLLRKLEGRS